MVFKTAYEKTAEIEKCRWFEAVSCRPDNRHYSNTAELRSIAFGWFDDFKRCGISTLITRQPYKDGYGYTVYREGPRWKMKAQKAEPQIIEGEVIVMYDEKGVFAPVKICCHDESKSVK